MTCRQSDCLALDHYNIDKVIKVRQQLSGAASCNSLFFSISVCMYDICNVVCVYDICNIVFKLISLNSQIKILFN